MTEASKGKRSIDWEAIEADFRAGLLSLREISAQHEVSHVAIDKRAKKLGWSRNLTAKIHAKADALVNAAAVNNSVNKNGQLLTNEREIVEANAERIASVRKEHRRDITRMRSLVLSLLTECEAQTNETRAFQELGELLRSDDERGQDKLNDIYQKSISLPTRIKGVKELCEAMKTLVAMEREAYGIKDASASDEAMESLSDEALTAKLKAYVARAL